MWASLAFTGAQSALAGVPAFDTKCSTELPGLNHPGNGTGVYFDEQCTTGYVLPPIEGESSLAALARNAGNLQFCPAVLKAGTLATSLVDSAIILSEKIQEKQKSLDLLQTQLNEIDRKASDAEIALNETRAKLDLANAALQQAQTNLVLVKGEVDTCDLLGGTDCDAKKANLLELRTAYLEQKSNADLLRIEEINTRSAMERAKAEKTRLQNPFDNAIATLEELQGKLVSIFTNIDSLRQNWVKLEGATAQLVYRLPWSTLVQKYTELNAAYKDKGITFTPIPLSDTRLFATQKIANSSELSSLPAVISAVMPGSAPYGINHLDGGNVTIDPTVTDEEKATAQPNVNSFLTGGLSSVSSQVILSLNGACQFFPKGNESPEKTTVEAKELSAHMVVNANVTYPVKVKRKYKATYNLSNVVSRLESRSAQKKWFFQSKDVHDLIIDNKSNDWFKIEFEAEHKDASFTDVEQQKITQEVKADLLARVLKNTSVITGTAPAMPAYGKTGYENAEGMNKALEALKCLKWYCKGFKYSMGVLDGFFGKKAAVSNFKQSNSAWVSDQVAHAKVVSEERILTFTPERVSQP